MSRSEEDRLSVVAIRPSVVVLVMIGVLVCADASSEVGMDLGTTKKYSHSQQQRPENYGNHGEEDLDTWTLEFNLDHPDIRHSSTGEGESTWGHFTCLGALCKHWLLPTSAVCTGDQHRSLEALADIHPRAHSKEVRQGLSPILSWTCSLAGPDNLEDHYGYSAIKVVCPTHPLEKEAAVILSTNALLKATERFAPVGPSVSHSHHAASKSNPEPHRRAEEGDDRKWVKLIDSFHGSRSSVDDEWIYDCHLSFRVDNYGPLHAKISAMILVGTLLVFLIIMFCIVGSKSYNHEVARARMGHHFDKFEQERLQAQKDRAFADRNHSTADDHNSSSGTRMSAQQQQRASTKLDMMNVDAALFGPPSPGYNTLGNSSRGAPAGHGGAIPRRSLQHEVAASGVQQRKRMNAPNGPNNTIPRTQAPAGSHTYLNSLDIGGVTGEEERSTTAQQQPSSSKWGGQVPMMGDGSDDPRVQFHQRRQQKQQQHQHSAGGAGSSRQGPPPSAMKERILEAQSARDRGEGMPILSGNGGGFAFENPDALSLGELRRRQRGTGQGGPPMAMGGAGRGGSGGGIVGDPNHPLTAQEQAMMQSRLPSTLGNTFGIDGPM